MDTLMMAETDEVIREALETVEFTVVAEAGILDAVGASSYQRRREIENRDFFSEMMKRIERNHKTLFLIGEEAAQTQEVRSLIEELYPRCSIIGTEALEECAGATDNIVNLVNSLAPDVILSILPSPKQEHFLMQYRGKLSAALWYGIGGRPLQEQKSRFRDVLRNLIRVRKFEKQVNQYHDNNT
jgi:N-acetylglucosaminyldiphosphoundecaprenol N-acetyl-beta-D-mannosaminyltransferase